jgi:MazG family protein
MSEIDRLIAIMAKLRDPDGGCPWDLEQNFHTIAPYTIEEAYEVAEAIEEEDWQDLKGELGDLLFQVVFHARMAEEAGHFDFADVAAGINDKMVRRHPHVFEAKTGIDDAEAQTVAWEEMKAEERAKAAAKHGRPPSVLDGVSAALPALIRAEKLQKRVARVGFDWPAAKRVLDDVHEELDELKAEIETDAPHDRLEDELGDLLFTVVNLARHLGVDAEAALRRTNAKFQRRFRHVESRLAESGRGPEDSDLDEMDRLWNEAKTAARE